MKTTAGGYGKEAEEVCWVCNPPNFSGARDRGHVCGGSGDFLGGGGIADDAGALGGGGGGAGGAAVSAQPVASRTAEWSSAGLFGGIWTEGTDLEGASA